MLGILKEFCFKTNLHGFIYIVQPKRKKLERVFWSISIFGSFLLTGILIIKLIIESRKNTIVFYTDHNIINVHEINFPAVSICPGVILKSAPELDIDYFLIKEMIINGSLSANSLTMKELKMVHAASLIANDNFILDYFANFTIPTNDFAEILDKFGPLFAGPSYSWAPVSHYFIANYSNKYVANFTHNLWKTGVCYTFNFPNSSQMFHLNRISQYFDYKNSFALGSYKGNASEYYLSMDYPMKAKGPGRGLFMGFTDIFLKSIPREGFKTVHGFLYNAVPEKKHSGLKLIFHDPYEVISNDAKVIHARELSFIKISVSPKIMKFDASLIDIDIDERGCYVQNEKVLKFFKVYNKVNCEHECLADLTLKKCGCVQFFMVRNQQTQICGLHDIKCYQEVEKQFHQVKDDCRCYNPCEKVKYDVRVMFDWTRKFRYSRFGRYAHNIEMQIEFDSKEVLATSKRKGQTLVDVFSLVGGFLGLFAGFSFLSAGEIMQHLINPFMTFRRGKSTKVHSFGSNDCNERSHKTFRLKCIQYVLKYFENSSVHSFNHIGNTEKSIFERSIWIIIFIVSMILTFFMIHQAYKKLRSSEIVMSLEGSPTGVEDIPFPAFTLVPDINDFENYKGRNRSYLDLIEGSKKHYYRVKRGYGSGEEIGDHVFSTLCERLISEMYTINHSYNYTTTSQFVDYLRSEFRQERPWFVYRDAKWNEVIDPPFAEILTNYGFGYSFNLIEHSKLIDERVSRDFRYIYDDYHLKTNFPWRTSAGSSKGLNIQFRTNKLLEGCYDHDTIILHSPNELPITSNIIRLEDFASSDVFVTPEIFKIDDDLRSSDLKDRMCYFDDERKLKYFKIYTQWNCEMECLTGIIYDQCGCVAFYSIRNSSLEICDYKRLKTCAEGFYGFEDFKKYDHLYASRGICSCLPLCNYVSYSYEVFTKAHNTIQNLSVSVMWKDDEYYALMRYQQFRVVDFLSYVGGMLGLFAGISALSVVEFIYFFTLRLITDIWRQFH